MVYQVVCNVIQDFVWEESCDFFEVLFLLVIVILGGSMFLGCIVGFDGYNVWMCGLFKVVLDSDFEILEGLFDMYFVWMVFSFEQFMVDELVYFEYFYLIDVCFYQGYWVINLFVFLLWFSVIDGWNIGELLE